MNRKQKIGCGCDIAALAAVALAAGLIFWWFAELDRHPIEGWLDRPDTPEPTPSIYGTPSPTIISPKGTPSGTITP
ncbi:hypothetical protein [Actinomadura harenae]|uniref:hypothetical protein n=1 Tax=Actinomadura harenae TaxID=2483351 RepID=UPI001F1B5963|nr:hypothetical protein [Actinomadura harenae]